MPRPLRRGEYVVGNSGNPQLPTNLAGDILVVGALFGPSDDPTASGWNRTVVDTGSGKLVVWHQVSTGGVAELVPSVPSVGFVALAVKDAAHVDGIATDNDSGSSFDLEELDPISDEELLLDFVGGFASGAISTVGMPNSDTVSPLVAHHRVALLAGELDLTESGSTGTRGGTLDTSADWASVSLVVR